MLSQNSHTILYFCYYVVGNKISRSIIAIVLNANDIDMKKMMKNRWEYDCDFYLDLIINK